MKIYEQLFCNTVLKLFNLVRSELFSFRFHLPGSLATNFLLLRSPVYTIKKYQQNGLSTSNYKELFVFRNNNYNTRSKYDLTIPLVNSVLKGQKFIKISWTYYLEFYSS